MAAPMKRIAVAVCAALALGATPGVARAQKDPQRRIQNLVKKGHEKFQEAEYQAAIRVLAPIPHESAATRAQRLDALELIGISHLILHDQTQAKQAFEDMLAIDPGHKLRFDDGSPKILDFFDQVKKEYVPGFDATADVQLEHSAPRGATAGNKLEVEARVLVGTTKAKEIVLQWRRRGELTYNTAPMRNVDDNLWRVSIKPPASVDKYVLDYYIEVRNVAGGAIGRVGGKETPLGLSVAAGRGGTPTPWYRRWYVIAGGAAVLGVSGALLLTSGDSAPSGTLDPGRVTLSP